MDQSALFVCLITVPLLAQFRQCNPTILFAIVALVYAVFGSVNFVETEVIFSKFRDDEVNLNDTYYVVKLGEKLLMPGLVMAICAAVTWFQTRMGAMRYPRKTTMLFWSLHFGLIGLNLQAIVPAQLMTMPRRHIEYAEYFETVFMIMSWALIISVVTLLSLILLLSWSVALTWKMDRKA